eukprot:scaffold500_cov124-Cylindrotheca_fusiformis.AAC.1
MDATPPNVTFNRLEALAASHLGSEVTAFYTVPIVSDLESWNSYSVESQGWIRESYNIRGDTNKIPDPIEDSVFRWVNGSKVSEIQGSSPFFLPIWQVTPAPDDVSLINLNLLSIPGLREAFERMVSVGLPVVTGILDLNKLIDRKETSDGSAVESAFIYAILDSFDPSPEPVAFAVARISWLARLTGILYDDTDIIICVLRSSCGDEHSFSLKGAKATYLGPGDSFVDSKYEYLEDVISIGDAYAGVVDSMCSVEFHLYPTAEMEANFHTNRPAVYTSVVAAIFAFACLVFVAYDYLVAMRLSKVNKAAEKSATIVASLFPDGVRSRLMNPEEVDKRRNRTTKSQLKQYLQDDAGPSSVGHVHSGEVDQEILESKPIADLFPHTTVIFADIAGFTAWSSVREPSQVFTLLETVYRSFDRVAHHRGVFKVETVGDCYVAVTGLPEPRPDHAEAMARFARDCMIKMNDLTHKLEITLGPDTGELAMRFGMHSGPVTAGVLRGDKSRFQLFGDTVNTAARIESTGVKNRIHLSEETAKLLLQSEKKTWVIPREDMVVAKGKGKMKTYWLLPSGFKPAEYKKALAESGVKKAMSERAKEGIIPSLTEESTKLLRLVDWTVDVLKRLLKQISAHREIQDNPAYSTERELRDAELAILSNTANTLDEVEEVVTLPVYSGRTTQTRHIADVVDLPEKAVEQLVEYVRTIATMYRTNSFHNFEHASHVTMSISKLLSRIVAPDLDFENNEANLHDHTYGITSDPLTQFAVVFSGLIHDVDHVGIPNYLLLEENKDLSLRYKNKSVAEQNSVDLAWSLLMQTKFCALRRCIYQSVDELVRFRQMVVNTVLATDIFDGELQALRKARWNKAFSNATMQHESAPEANKIAINRKATIVIEHLIQASDVSHTMQHWHIYQKWNERLFEEMYLAFKTGRSSKSPALNWYEGELGFFDNYIIPLAKKLKDCGVFGVSSDEYLNYAVENRNEWASKGKKVVAMLMAKHADVDEDDSSFGPSEHESQRIHYTRSPKAESPGRRPESLNQKMAAARRASYLRRNSAR